MKPLLAIGIVIAVAFALMHASWALFGQGQFLPGIPIVGRILHPINITTTGGTISDSAPQGTQIATLAVTMSDGSPFSGTLTAQDGTGIVCSVSPCTVGTTIVTARNVSATDDGQHTVPITANSGTQPFTKAFTLIVQPTVVGIACDVGPNYSGSIPAGAQAAGFTHCAANFDFTQAAFSNVNTWLDCTGRTKMFFFNNNGSGATTPCSAVSITTDAAGGAGQVLDMHWDPSWQPFSEIDPAQLFPEGLYIDFVLRYTSNYLTANGNTETLIGSLYSESNNCCSVNQYEWDLDEQAIKPLQPSLTWGYTATHPVQWTSAGPVVVNSTPVQYNNIGNFNPTIYQNYAVRITTDGNTAWSMCNYWNSQFESCDNFTAPFVMAAADQLSRWKLQVGPISSTNNVGNAYDQYWQRVTFWTCPAWSPANQLTQCNNNPTKSGPP